MKNNKRTTYLSRVQSEYFSRKWYRRNVTLFCNLLFTGQWMRKAQIVRCLVVEISEGGAIVRVGKSQVPNHFYLVIGRFDVLIGSIVVQRDPGHLHLCFLKELRPDFVNRLARMKSPFATLESLSGSTISGLENMQPMLRPALALAEEALAQGLFFLHYQPKIALDTGKRVGFEALLRLKKADGSVLGPAAFATAFDEPTLSRHIGSHVLRSAVAQAKAWTEAGLDFGHIAVNVSSSQFVAFPDGPGLVDEVLGAIRSAGLSPRHIQIEVTEGVMLSAQGGNIGMQLEALRAAGLIVAFDDFGTGFASLIHLKELAYDQIKIDGAFVRAMTRSSADHAIVKAIIDMAKAMGKDVVAEGVETVLELQALQELGCPYGQGYLFGPPAGASEFQF